MDDIINMTESTVLISRAYYEEHMKKFKKLMKNNKRRVRKIKNLKKTVYGCQVANHKYKSKIDDLEKEIKEMEFQRDFWKDKCLDNLTDNQILRNELDMVIDEGYELSSSYEKYMESRSSSEYGGFIYD